MEEKLKYVEILGKDISENDADGLKFKCLFNDKEFLLDISFSLLSPKYGINKQNYLEKRDVLIGVINDIISRYLNANIEQHFIEILIFAEDYFFVMTDSCPDGFKVYI